MDRLLDLGGQMELRLATTKKERTALRDVLKSLDTKIKSCIARIGDKPRESLEEIETMLRQIEHEHKTAPNQSRQDERDFMRRCDALKKKKKDALVYSEKQAELDAAKAERKVKLEELRSKDRLLDDLYSDLKRLKVAKSLGLSVVDIYDKKIDLSEVSEDAAARVIGKGGQNAKRIEETCGVSLDSTRSGSIWIYGPQENIAMATEAVNKQLYVVVKEISPSDEILAALVVDQAALAHYIQGLFDVRLDISRANKICKIMGQKKAVVEAEAAVLSLKALRIDFPIDPNSVPSLLGKGGSNFRELQTEDSVLIEISTDRCLVSIFGLEDDVRSVADKMIQLIEDKSIVEVNVSAMKIFVLRCLLAAGSVILRRIQTNHDVSIKIDRGDGSGSMTQDELIKISGSIAKVTAAKAELEAEIAEFSQSFLSFSIPTDCIRKVLGKGGENIEKLRSKYAQLSIDVDSANGLVMIFSKDEAVRENTRLEIDDIIQRNKITILPYSRDDTLLLKSQMGSEVLLKLRDELHVDLKINSEEEEVIIRGREQDILEAVQCLELFRTKHTRIQMNLEDEDMKILVDDNLSLLNSVKVQFEVNILTLRTSLCIIIIGEKEAAYKAKSILEDLFSGRDVLGLISFHVDPIYFSYIIGKNGSTIGKFESEHQIRIYLSRQKERISLRSLSQNDETALEDLRKAKLSILGFLDSLEKSVSLPPITPEHCGSEDTEKVLTQLAELFGLTMINRGVEASEKLLISGSFAFVDKASKYLQSLRDGQVSYVISILKRHADALTETVLRPIEEVFNVKIAVKVVGIPSVIVSGTREIVPRAITKLYELFDKLFPEEVVTVIVDPGFLLDMSTLVQLDRFRSEFSISLSVDILSSSFQIAGDSCEVEIVADTIKEKLREWKDLRCQILVKPPICISSIMTAYRADLTAIASECEVKIFADRNNSTLNLSAASRQNLEKAQALLHIKMIEMEKEVWTYSPKREALVYLLGKKGQRAQELRKTIGANIDFDFKYGTLTVRGKAEKVEAAQEKIMEIINEYESSMVSEMFSIRIAATSIVIGKGGETIRDITSKSGAKVNVDKEANKTLIRIRGKDSERASALFMINNVLEANGFEGANQVFETVEPMTSTHGLGAAAVAAETLPSSIADYDKRSTEKAATVRIPPGASPALVSQLERASLLSTLSASARRRLRRKERENITKFESSTDDDSCSYDVEESDSTGIVEENVSGYDGGEIDGNIHGSIDAMSPVTQSSCSTPGRIAITGSLNSQSKSSLLSFLLNVDGTSLLPTVNGKRDSYERQFFTANQSANSATSRYVSKSGISIRL